MKELNRGRFLHAKAPTCENEFHAASFPFRILKYLTALFSPLPIKENLPFHQPTPFIMPHFLLYFRGGINSLAIIPPMSRHRRAD